jgi:murein DD-endopeptidase MepM/ murein hydrolase activator NlpD
MTVSGAEWYVCDMGTEEGYYWVKASAVQDAKVSETTTTTTAATTTQPTTTAAPTTLDIRWPVTEAHGLTDGWGWRSASSTIHNGTDISVSGINGKQVRAIADGTVVTYRREDDGRGYYIVIEHEIPGKGTYSTSYCHMQPDGIVQSGHVTAGQRVGYVGSTGASTGPHLHFEMWRTSRTYNINVAAHYGNRDTRTSSSNPEPFFKKTGSTYAYNPNFDWNYSENPLPDRYSHSESYHK